MAKELLFHSRFGLTDMEDNLSSSRGRDQRSLKLQVQVMVLSLTIFKFYLAPTKPFYVSGQ